MSVAIIGLGHLIERISSVLEWINDILRVRFLFKDGFDEYQNKDAFQALVVRYKDSIDDSNKKIGFTLTFTVIAIYVYFMLPDTEAIQIPLVGISVSRQVWISIAPAISFGLEVLVITSLLWFVALKSGLQTLITESRNRLTINRLSNRDATSKYQGASEAYADITSILLKGLLGDLWMILGIRRVFRSRLNYIWYIPLMCLAFLVLLCPTIIAVFFTYQLFLANHIALGIIYAMIFIPVAILLLIMIVMVGLVGTTKHETIRIRVKGENPALPPNAVETLAKITSKTTKDKIESAKPSSSRRRTQTTKNKGTEKPNMAKRVKKNTQRKSLS